MLTWERADLSAWGEYIDTPQGRYSKTWGYTDEAKNADGCQFSLSFSGKKIAENIDGPTIDHAEDQVDILVNKHRAETGHPPLTQ